MQGYCVDQIEAFELSTIILCSDPLDWNRGTVLVHCSETYPYIKTIESNMSTPFRKMTSGSLTEGNPSASSLIKCHFFHLVSHKKCLKDT
jgi:hypothetical protein